MNKDDLLLIKEWQTGDISAYDTLVKRYKEQIYLLAFQITGNHQDANDISQLTFIQVYKSVNKFKGHSKFSTWLQRIAVNLSINYKKKELRHEHENLDEDTLDYKYVDRMPKWINNPVDEIEAKELVQQIKNAMDSLSVGEKVVFILRVHQGLSYKEIASTLNCPVGTVMSRLNSARKRLRNRLKNYVI